MTYIFPPSLYPLRDYLRSVGADALAFATDRQAAYMAQQLLGTLVKFPPKGQDMTPTLSMIQKSITEAGPRNQLTNKNKALATAADQILLDSPPTNTRRGGNNGKRPKGGKSNIALNFSQRLFAEGMHIFCDGAAVPNPGAGGWGVVVYRDGVEIESVCGGEAQTTNNRMEMTALLNAIGRAKGYCGLEYPQPVAIWSDSRYAVDGVNSWMEKWRKHGWKRSANARELVKNAALWSTIDDALRNLNGCQVTVRWVKGHSGILGNERADELAESGRQTVLG